MVPVTRNTDPLENLLSTVFNATDPDHRMRLALSAAGCQSIVDELDLSKEDLKSIEWLNSAKEVQKLRIVEINSLLAVSSWFAAQSIKDESVFLTLTPDILSSHRRTSVTFPAPATLTAVSGVTAPSSAKPSSALSAADEFKKGIKRDITAFTTFKDKKSWNQWYRSFTAIADAQGLGNVLNPSYKPVTPEEQTLFGVLQSYAFAIVTTHLREPQAAEIVRKYSGSLAGPDKGDAQKLHAELVQKMSSGMAAKTTQDQLQTKLTSLCLNNTWNNGINAFLTHFSHVLRDLRELHHPGDTSSYNDEWCMMTIDMALSTHAEMTSHVNSLATTRFSVLSLLPQGTSLPVLTCDTYLSQLSEHAIVLNNHINQTHLACRLAIQSSRSTSQGLPGQRGTAPGHGRGRGDQPSRGQHCPTHDTPRDVTDPSIWLTPEQYSQLSPEQRRARYEHLQVSRATAPAPTCNIPPVPGTVQANATTVDNQSVLSTPSAAPTAPATQPGTVLRSMMSNANSHASPSPPASSSTSAAPTNDSITINSVMYTQHVNATHVYRLRETDARLHSTGSLVDGGANGGLTGADMHILESEIHATADVHGIANTFESLPLVQAAAKIDTCNDGPIIGIFSHYAQRPDDGPTIHSKSQMESFGLLIDDKSHVIGGTQCIVTNEGYVVPLHIRNDLPYMSMSQPTDADMASFPHVFFCPDFPWDPSYLDGEFDATKSELPAEALACRESNNPCLDDYGGIVCHTTVIDRLVETCSYNTCSSFTIAATTLSAFPRTIVPKLPDLNSLRPHFGWVPTDCIKATLDATAQYYCATMHYPFCKHFKSRFPAAKSTASPNGLPLILSSLICPPMMIVSLAMVDVPCCSSMEVSTPTSLPATPCRQKLPCPKLLKILFVIMVP